MALSVGATGPDGEAEGGDDTAYIFVVGQSKGAEKQVDTRPVVDSGAIVSCCPKWYADQNPLKPTKSRMTLRSVLNEELQHFGQRDNVFVNERGCAL